MTGWRLLPLIGGREPPALVSCFVPRASYAVKLWSAQTGTKHETLDREARLPPCAGSRGTVTSNEEWPFARGIPFRLLIDLTHACTRYFRRSTGVCRAPCQKSSLDSALAPPLLCRAKPDKPQRSHGQKPEHLRVRRSRSSRRKRRRQKEEGREKGVAGGRPKMRRRAARAGAELRSSSSESRPRRPRQSTRSWDRSTS